MPQLDDDGAERARHGLSNRTWQDVWRDKKIVEMESYSYAVIDQTLGWTRGTAWAIHHGQEPPALDHDEAVKLRDDVDQLRADVADLRATVADLDSALKNTQKEGAIGVVLLDDEVQGLKLLLPALLKELGRRARA